ncbi:BZ3500_MvSof-1268-A1-R1_Chr7-1g09177 [Microbotryum saponariae]|uniref:Dihydrolipoamide acetyltransferase component of pyruvate dehydrogenase complex n=1 Tax=Microbotryum saponariae TaxID=289078 RepID=A0A2X0L840_9BASI|nr:BZ3501_MvSof-1269-A2-R1_Chr7-1g08882 [Microbotryum saponariae]SDA02944.1 BZ3500_MvSof-1268-A1-R1_Chr7-1g09177 [Microbotryum saponariae]
MIRQLVQQRARSLARSSLSSPRYLHATSRSHALTKFMFPAMSPTMTEGGIASWKKKEGEAFAPGDVLLEIETDKATMDVEAQDEGVLGKIIVGDGAKGVKVGSIVAILAEEGDDVSEAAIKALTEDGAGEAAPAEVAEDKPQEKASEAPEPKKQETKSETPSVPKKESSMQPSGDHPVILASPLAKRLALEQGIPLAKIKGSGPGGRIVKTDIESYKPEAPKAAAASSSSSSAPAPSASSSAAPAKFTDTPVSNMRRTIASRLTDSKSGTPHYYLTTEINMDRVAKLRDVFNSAAKSAEAAGGVKDGVKTGTKLSFNDFVVKASALALNDVPEVNSGWHGDFVRQ